MSHTVDRKYLGEKNFPLKNSKIGPTSAQNLCVMVLATSMVLTYTHGIESVLLNHTRESRVSPVSVMSEDRKMDLNEYPNIFRCHLIYQTIIRIYLDDTYLPNKYPNILVLGKCPE